MKVQLSGNSLIRLALVSMIGLAISLNSGVPAQAAIEDILLEKGVITKEVWVAIKAEKEQEIKAAKEKDAATQTNASPVASSPSPATPTAAPASPSNEGASLKVVEREKEPTTGELISGSGFQKIRYKDVYLAPGGFAEGTTIWRSQNQNADVGSTYGNIPLSGSTNSKMSEFRGSARQSRLSLLAETQPTGVQKLSGYVEGDFLGVGVTSNEQESNSWAPRLRQFWATVDFDSKSSLTVGQAWSLLTTHRQGLMPRSEYIPYTIDAQYVVGYNWTRQFQVRVAQDFGNGVWAAFSIENPETIAPNVTAPAVGAINSGVVLPANVQGFAGSSNTANPSSTLNGGSVSTDVAPDLVSKLVVEPGWGHWELKALGRFFRDRLNGGNHNAFGGGVGAAAILPVHNTLNFIVEGLSGAGIGRYASSVGTDVIAKTDGTVVPIRATQLMTGLEWKPTAAWDWYAYYGYEYYDRAAYAGTNVGYGSSLNNLSGCSSDFPAGVCQAANKTVWQLHPGFWYRFFQGRTGIAAVGLDYSFTHRQLWEGLNGAPGKSVLNPNGRENILMASFRYYLP